MIKLPKVNKWLKLFKFWFLFITDENYQIVNLNWCN